MNLSFLVILNLLVLYFIYRQQRRNNIDCKHVITLYIVFILILYEIYMTSGYNKNNNKNKMM